MFVRDFLVLFYGYVRSQKSEVGYRGQKFFSAFCLLTFDF